MDLTRFADHTQRFLNTLPHWFEMRQDPDSVGARFLNISGLEYDELALALSEAEEHLYLQTASIEGLDVMYKLLIPVHLNSGLISQVFSDHLTLTQTTSLETFSIGPAGEELDRRQDRHPYFLDEEKNILYVRQPYDAFDHCPYGRLSYILDGKVYQQELRLHHVWNFLDEFGLLLCCPRLTKESNKAYKERLLDVFQHPGGSNKSGLLNGIGRELALRKTLIWQQSNEPFPLTDAMIALNSIELNGKPCLETDWEINLFGQVELFPKPDLTGPIRVSYLYGIEMHQLANKQDTKLQQELLNLDNTASDLLKYYVERIHLEAPINWGHFKWDESYWDTATPEVTGSAFISNLQDASIEGFRAYQ